MDPRLLHYYNLELQHLREMGAECERSIPIVPPIDVTRELAD